MATTKKKPVTKTPATKTSAKTKTVAAKATTARKTTSKNATAKKQRTSALISFRPSKEQTPFLSFNFTTQSLYWLILSVIVLALGAWVMYLNVKIQNIYDQVEINTQLSDTHVKTPAHKVQNSTAK